MKSSYIGVVLFFYLIFGSNSMAYSQQGSCIILNLKNGYTVKGEIVESTTDFIKVKTLNGQEITYKNSEISSKTNCKASSRSSMTGSYQSDIKLGVLAAYGTEIKSPGFGVKIHYGLTDEFRLASGFIYFLPKTDFELKSTVMNLDLDGNYIISGNDNISFHALAGLNITRWNLSYSINYPEFGIEYEFDESYNKLGLNIGLGMTYSFSAKSHLLLESKYVLSDYDQFVISAGFMFKL